jgi:hypothetical protein
MTPEELKAMNEQQLVAEAVRLDQQQKDGKRTLDAVKAELQARGLALIEDRNIRYVKFRAPEGSAAVTDAQSLEVLNADRLRDLLTEGVWNQNVTVTVKTDYKYKPLLERVLKAVFTGEYTFEYTLEEFLEEHLPAVPDAKQMKLLARKLKGDYAKDREVLTSVLGLPEDTDLDVELWYINRIKNGELIRAMFPEEFLGDTIEAVRKCLIVDTKTAITIDYDKE